MSEVEKLTRRVKRLHWLMHEKDRSIQRLEQKLHDNREGYQQLRRENAKLRELCAGLWNVMWACAEQRCPHRHEDCFVVNGNGDGHKGHGECWYKLRMRELGVEVDE